MRAISFVSHHVSNRFSSGAAIVSILVGGALAMGCSGATPDAAADESEGALGDTPTLTFAADGAVTQSGAIASGGKVRVQYNDARLPDCRGDFEGKPGWTITGFASNNGTDPIAFATGKTATIAVPASGDLALWFQVTNRWGCSAYDSKYGSNYHFTVKATPEQLTPSIVFDEDGQTTTSGQLKAGGKVTVKFAQERLDQCRGSQGGFPQWNITGYASLNGQKAQTFETSEADRNGNRVDVETSIALPESGDLALWFQGTSRYGCSEFDSKSGANYHFAVR
jgi:hypothetical protein